MTSSRNIQYEVELKYADLPDLKVRVYAKNSIQALRVGLLEATAKGYPNTFPTKATAQPLS